MKGNINSCLASVVAQRVKLPLVMLIAHMKTAVQVLDTLLLSTLPANAPKEAIENGLIAAFGLTQTWPL